MPIFEELVGAVVSTSANAGITRLAGAHDQLEARLVGKLVFAVATGSAVGVLGVAIREGRKLASDHKLRSLGVTDEGPPTPPVAAHALDSWVRGEQLAKSIIHESDPAAAASLARQIAESDDPHVRDGAACYRRNVRKGEGLAHLTSGLTWPRSLPELAATGLELVARYLNPYLAADQALASHRDALTTMRTDPRAALRGTSTPPTGAQPRQTRSTMTPAQIKAKLASLISELDGELTEIARATRTLTEASSTWGSSLEGSTSGTQIVQAIGTGLVALDNASLRVQGAREQARDYMEKLN